MKHPQKPEHAPLLTREELASRWQVSHMTLHRWRNEGKILALKMGRGVRFPLSEVERFEREARVSHSPTLEAATVLA